MTKEEYQARKCEGRCIYGGCRESAADDSNWCAPHRTKLAAYQKRYYATHYAYRKSLVINKNKVNRQRRLDGLCILCMKPARAQFCAGCVPKARAWRQATATGPHTYCWSCRKRGHRWEDCKAPTDARIEDYATSRPGSWVMPQSE